MVNIRAIVIPIILFVIAPLICYIVYRYNKWLDKRNDKRSAAEFLEFKKNNRDECYKCNKWMSILDLESHRGTCTGTGKEKEEVVVNIPDPESVKNYGTITREIRPVFQLQYDPYKRGYEYRYVHTYV